MLCYVWCEECQAIVAIAVFFILEKNFVISYDGGLSASTGRHELMEDKNLRIYFGMSFGQLQAVEVSTNLLRVLVAKWIK